MTDQDRLAERFEEQRPHLRGVAYRMLGSVSDADDAVQDAWLRLSRSDADAIEDLRAWLTTVVARLCLNMLRTRGTRRETALEPHLPDPLIAAPGTDDPEHEAILGEGVGLALQVVLDALTPAERSAFVLHDVFGMPFEEVAAIVGRTPAAARQLASRARRRVRAAPEPDTDLEAQWSVVDAYIAASRAGDLDGLLAILDPDVVLRSDGGPGRPGLTTRVEGAAAVAGNAILFRRAAATATRTLINGAAGVVAWTSDGRPFALLAPTISAGRIVAIDILVDAHRLAGLPLVRETH